MSSLPVEVVPEAYVCPILCSMMVDPVVAGDGHTYERRAIESWLSQHSTSPLAGTRLESKSLVPNHALKSLIADYCQGDGKRQREFLLSKQNLAQVSPVQVARAVEDKEEEVVKPVYRLSPSSSKRPVIVCASRRTLNSGEGVLVGYAPTADESAFEAVFTLDLKLDSPSSFDESLSAITKLSDHSFVAGGRNGTLSAFELGKGPQNKVSVKRTWSSKQSSAAHQQEVTCMAQVAPYHLVDGTNTSKPLLASGSRDYSVKVWAPTTTGAWKLKTELSHRSEVFCLTGAFQGQVISGGADWNLKLWDVNACEYGEPVQTLEAHSKSVKCCATSPDSANLLVSGSEDETMCVWDLRSNGLVHRIDTGSAVRCLYWANGLLCAGGGVTLDSWSGASLEPMGGWLRFFDPRAGFQPLSDASIYPVSRVVRSDGDDRRLRTAHVLSTMCISGFQLANHQQVVVSGGDDKKLRVWTSAKSQQVLGETAPFSTKPQLSFELGSDKTIPISVDCLEVFQV